MSAFAGVRILDFTQGVAGPMATMLLADFGADVVKVEPPGGDRMKDHPGYLAWNRNKRRVVLDLHRYEGIHAARQLIAGADAVLFDAHPGELERLGLDATTLLAAHPSLLHVNMPPYGERGRWSQLPPDEMLLASLSAVAFLQLSYEDVPVHLVTPQIAYGHAILTAGVLSAGLYERAKSGRGQAVTVSGLHGVSAVESSGHIIAGDVFRLGARSSRGGVPHYRLYQCADGEWFFLGTLTGQFFLKALEAIGLTDLIVREGIDGDFTNLMRPPGADIAIRMLDERFKEKPREEWLRILHEAGVPRGPVGKREEWFRSETVAVNEMRIVLEHPKLGPVEIPGVPAKLSDTPGSVRALQQDAKVEDVISAWSRQPLTAQLSPASAPAGGPLAGVRVLDLGAFIAGTFAPTVLANFGADVMKVEPFDGDPFRAYGLGFVGHNQGKRSLAIDLKSEEGRTVFLDLVRGADVVLDNFRTGVRERLGIDYAALAKVNPRIISCSVTGYGPAGPLSDDPGFDPLLQARSGMMAAQGGSDEPVFHQIAVNDSASALMAAFGIIAALYARERTGRGQEVLTCLANQTIICQSGEVTWYEGRPPSPTGAIDCVGETALRRYYRCADGWLVLACSEPGQFHQVAVALGHAEWAGRMTAEAATQQPVDGPLAELIAGALADLPVGDAIDRLLSRGVPAAPAATVDDIFNDPWALANNHFQWWDHPQFGPMQGVRGYADWSRTPGGFAYRAPLIGEQSTDILESFDIGTDRIAELVIAGIVRQA
jgi:crotonobetainyl-CoA:carnitine CoA-transferase CaiB-like acyl-CoA transferase